MMFGDQAEPESALISLVKMMEKSVEPFVEGLVHQEFPGGDAERAVSHLP